MAISARLLLSSALILPNLITAGSASADSISCEAGTLGSLLGTACTIGSVEFSFRSITSDSRSGGVSNPTDANEIWFTPGASSLGPGFTWSGNFEVSSSPDEFDNILRIQLVLGVKTLVPGNTITGITSIVGRVNASPSIGNSGFAFAQAQSSNWPCAGACAIATATEGWDHGRYIASRSTSLPTEPFTDSAGLVQFLALAQYGGSVSFDSVGFGFKEAAVQVPESASWLLATLVAGALVARRPRILELDRR